MARPAAAATWTCKGPWSLPPTSPPSQPAHSTRMVRACAPVMLRFGRHQAAEPAAGARGLRPRGGRRRVRARDSPPRCRAAGAVRLVRVGRVTWRPSRGRCVAAPFDVNMHQCCCKYACKYASVSLDVNMHQCCCELPSSGYP